MLENSQSISTLLPSSSCKSNSICKKARNGVQDRSSEYLTYMIITISQSSSVHTYICSIHQSLLIQTLDNEQTNCTDRHSNDSSTYTKQDRDETTELSTDIVISITNILNSGSVFNLQCMFGRIRRLRL